MHKKLLVGIIITVVVVGVIAVAVVLATNNSDVKPEDSNSDNSAVVSESIQVRKIEDRNQIDTNLTDKKEELVEMTIENQELDDTDILIFETDDSN